MAFEGWTARLWIVLALGLGLRLIGLDEPLIDKQAWRQTDTAAIARNFFEEDQGLFFPRVDWRGTTSGHVETNFPLFPYAVSLLYEIAGVREWLGRLLAALSSTATAALLYLLALRLGIGAVGALTGVLCYLLFPISIYFGRTFMPEALMLLLSVATLWTFVRWLDDGRRSSFVLAVVVAALCFMVKIPTLYLGFPLVALAWSQWGWRFIRMPVLWLYLALVLLPAVLWYWHASLLFEETGLTFGIWNRYGYDKWDRSLWLQVEFYWTMVVRFCHNIYTPIGAALILRGLYLWPVQRRQRILWAWMGALLLYVFIVPEGNRKLHYYQLPFAPVGGLFAGWALEALLSSRTSRSMRWVRNWQAWQRVVVVSAFFVAIGAYSTWAARPYYEQPNNLHNYYSSCYAAGRIVDDKLPKEVLLVVGDLDENAGAPNRSQSPTMLYYCHRDGWQITPEEFTSDRLDSLAAVGADYFLVAGRFAMDNKTLWPELLRRGVTTPTGYPHMWHETAEFLRFISKSVGDDRHFVLVPLGRETGG